MRHSFVVVVFVSDNDDDDQQLMFAVFNPPALHRIGSAHYIDV